MVGKWKHPREKEMLAKIENHKQLEENMVAAINANHIGHSHIEVFFDRRDELRSKIAEMEREIENYG